MNDPSRTTNRRFGIWQPPGVGDSMGFGNPGPVFAAAAAAGGQPGRVNWKGRKAGEKRKNAAAAVAGAASGQKPPALGEVQPQNRGKPFFRFYPRRKPARFAPFAPRNTTSFIIRAKKAGGIASLVSPCPVTPAILPTPKFSPSREHLVDMAKEEWGVDGYGSMKGLIRLRSPTANEMRGDEEDDMEEGSSESEVEEHVEVERRLDHDLSRFEMVYPTMGDDHGAPGYLLENRVDDQDAHIAQLEEENLTLKEKLFLMEREMGDLRRRMQLLETRYRGREGNNDGSNNKNDVGNNMNLDEEASKEEVGDVSSEQSVGD
uniref:Early endosome antigen 1 n=1 Tax=Anthurium amnicola TaxID=1678845 RepID=A0A1D1Z0X4_9ARAE